MKKVCKIVLSLCFLASILVINSTLYAAEGLKIGDAEIIPWGEVRLQYDDNIFLDSDDEKDDIIVTLVPGVSLEWPFSDNLLKLDYHAEITEFMDYGSNDATNHYFSGDLEVELQDLTFNIYDDYKHVYERASTEDTLRIKREDNTIGIRAGLEKDRLGVQLGYEHFTRDYKDEDTYDIYDRKEDIYSAVLTHQTFAKTKLLAEYDFGQIRYDSSTRSDSDYHQFLVGAIGELTPKTTATVKAGYQFREYDDSTQPDFDTGVLYADLTHEFSEKDALKLSLTRTAYESTYDINNYYIVENVTAIYDHYFTAKLLGFVNGIYQVNSYPRETTEGTETHKREDRYASLGAGFRYYMQEWLTFTMQLEHIDRDSNFDTFDYEQNLATLTAKAVF